MCLTYSVCMIDNILICVFISYKILILFVVTIKGTAFDFIH